MRFFSLILFHSLIGAVFFSATFAPSVMVAQIVYSNNFDQHTKSKKYRVSVLNEEWNNPGWERGVTQGRVKIKTGYQAFGYSGACLADQIEEEDLRPQFFGCPVADDAR